MKKFTLLSLTLLLTTSSFISSCSNDDDSFKKNEIINKEFSTSTFVDKISNGSVSLLSEKSISLNKNISNKNNQNEYDNNGVEIILKNANNTIVKVTTFKNLKNENQFLSIVENQDQKKYIEYVQNIDSNGNVLNYNLLEKSDNIIQSRDGRSWWQCMGDGFQNRDFATTVGILGAAGGAGCVACGIAGGAIVCVLALGCLG